MTVPADFVKEIEAAAEAEVEHEEEKNNGNDTGSVDEGVRGGPGDGEGDKAHPKGGGGGDEEREEDAVKPAGDDEEEVEDGGEEEAGDGDDEDKPEGVSDEAIARAIRAGLRVDEAIALGSDDRVNEIASRLEADAESAYAAEVAEAEAKAAAEAEQARKEKEREELAGMMPELDPEETDPKVIEAFNRMMKRFEDQQDRLDRFEQQQAERNNAVSAANEQELLRWYEGELETLNKTFSETLGKGVAEAITVQSRKGDLIAEKMAALIGSYTAQGQRSPPREEVFSDAARLVLKDEFAKMEEAKLAQKVKKRAGMEISPPGGSKGKAKKSPEDATADLLDERFFGR